MIYKIDALHFLDWYSALLGHGQDWLVQRQDNVPVSWCQRAGVPGGQYYKVIMSAHCHKSEPILT